MIAVIGGGAAGMMAAIIAARNGKQVALFEKNEKLGKKLYITGKGRCNLTNASDIETLFSKVVTNRKFLYSAFYGFDNMQTMSFFEELGLKIKVERGERVFPDSDKSSDVISVLQKELRRLGVKIYFNTEVLQIQHTAEQVTGLTAVHQGEKKHFSVDAVIIATGGVSYPVTGSTGDGYRFAKDMGHTVTPLSQALVPMQTKETYVTQMQGLSLRNVSLKAYAGKKKVFEDMGELLFTHFGVSGPLVLSASSYVAKYMDKQPVTLELDLKPALTTEQLDARVVRDFQKISNKQFKNAFDQLLPKKMIPVMVSLSGVDPGKPIHSVTKEERQKVVALLKCFPMHVEKLRGYQEAIITQGGIAVKEVNPATMESNKVSGLYFAGEVLDLDALTGGYNLQIAWSTAYLAGMAASEA